MSYTGSEVFKSVEAALWSLCDPIKATSFVRVSGVLATVLSVTETKL